MANRIAQQSADAAEQNAYRNYLNEVANTNIRKQEQGSLDRYRQGELGIRGQDVMGMNEYRRGQIGIGETDVRNRGTYQAEMARIAGLEAMNRADAIREQGRIQDAMMRAQERIAGLQYEKVPAERKMYFDLLQANPNMMATPEERMMLLNQEQERENAYRSAVINSIPKYIDQYNWDKNSFWTGFGMLNPNDPSTKEIDKLISEKGLTLDEAARVYSEQQLAPLYGRSSAAAPRKVPSPAPSPVGLDGTNRPSPAVTEPLLSTNAASGATYDDFRKWLQSRSGK